MRCTRALIILVVLAAADCAHAADFSALSKPIAQPVRNPLEKPPDIVNPAVSETGD